MKMYDMQEIFRNNFESNKENITRNINEKLRKTNII